jgi:hypothetical protein
MPVTTDRAYSAGKAWRHARIKELTTSDRWSMVAWAQKERTASRQLLRSLPTTKSGVLEHLFRAYRLRCVQEEQAAQIVSAFEDIAAGRATHDPRCPVRVTLPDYRCKDAAALIMKAIRSLRSGKPNSRHLVSQALQTVRERRGNGPDHAEVELHLAAAVGFWN